MLLRLAIRDFAIVDRLELEFQRGFTVLTGETGAGKSILIDALALTLGERADASVVRTGRERADVTAEFVIDNDAALQAWLREQALEGDPGQLVMRRIVERSGRSRGLINGHAATLVQLRQAGDALVDIHGQHAHQSLLRADAQRQILDAQGGLAEAAAEVGDAYRSWRRLVQARAEQERNSLALNAERDQLLWQVDELTRLAPAAGEWEQVQAEQSRLAHAASLIEGASAAVDALSESESSAGSVLAAAVSRLRALVTYDPALQDFVALLDGAEAQMNEAVSGLRQYAERVDLDPRRLQELELRVEALHGAARKFRVRPEALPEALAAARARLAELDQASDAEAMAREEQRASDRYRQLAHKLTEGRRKAAAKLGREVTSAMRELAMAGARFDIVLRPLADGSAGGDEQVEFLVAANVGAEPQPLARVASGGEVSRISLAIQVVASKAAAVGTLIFDEVDAGIGGGVAEIVGQKLRALGERRQVLCVTHLGQVAAQATEQWSVSKRNDGDQVRSVVEVLAGQARVEEVARMIGGLEITAATRRHASELLKTR
ncbi:MAG: DNA repair protein RecN [Betaproteobacteria bacterium]|nr:DNA repair protein RecN [Betaproteobacteria bacterium]